MNKIKDFIRTKERKNFPFVPNQEFYEFIGVKRKRWWQLYRDEKSATIDELTKIAKFFDATINDLI